MNDRIRNISMLAALAALALVFGYLEALIPLPVSIPGVKLGLANVVVLVSLYALGPKASCVVMLLKVMLLAFIVGSPSMLVFSLAGSVLAWLGMLALYRVSFINIVAVSVVAAVLHNVGQLVAAYFVLQSAAVFLNLPFMLVAGCITGVLTGMLATAVLRALGKAPGLLSKNDSGGKPKDESKKPADTLDSQK